ECTESGNALEYLRRFYNLKLCDAVKYLQGGAQAAAACGVTADGPVHRRISGGVA
ncbi:MAG: hypothetical protein JNK24_09065, partial [Alphaproteobacteria bacterium]|nr:hypothetical protein [Alphaproteobacteria bacterium]